MKSKTSFVIAAFLAGIFFNFQVAMAGEQHVVTFSEQFNSEDMVLVLSGEKVTHGTVDVPGELYEMAFSITPGLLTIVNIPKQNLTADEQGAVIIVKAFADFKIHGFYPQSNAATSIVDLINSGMLE